MCFPVVSHLREPRSQQHEPAHASAPAAPADGQLASRAGRWGRRGVWMLGRDPPQFFSHRLRVLQRSEHIVIHCYGNLDGVGCQRAARRGHADR